MTKVYLVKVGSYYEGESIVKSFFDKQKAIDCLTEMAEKANKKDLERLKRTGESPEEYRYFLKKEDDMHWDNPIDYMVVEEIEVE